MRIQPIRISGFLLLLSALFLVVVVTGQAQTSISGVINSYAKVTSVDGTDRVTVDNPSLFSIGDTTLIIQMKGIEISVANSPSFGARQQANSAGYYEFIIIFDIIGNQVIFEADMSHTYDAGGHVQLIRARGFDNITVTGILTCDPWDPLSGTGGVVAMIVGNTLTLEADIDVSDRGFLGGGSVERLSGTCGVGDFFFNDASTEGGYKGEGIATYGYEIGGLPLGTDYIKGRGCYFNGGGGGNGKYSGGGGGGNGGKGGHGGKEVVSCGGLIWGVGAYNIPDVISTYKTDGRIFMGGGGGAGTQLSAGEGTDGGNGGGIVIIVADTLIGNGNSILANGESVAGIATGNAGAGGGGAGGTILLEVGSYQGSNLNLEAMGGNGGAVSGSPTCTGPGGGGGGGIIWHSGVLTPEVSTSVLPGVVIPGPCASMLAVSGSSGELTNDLIVPLTGFLFNSIYSSRTGMLLDTICEDEVPPLMLGTHPKGGTPGYTFVWESSEDKAAWNIVAGGTFQNYSPADPLIDTTYYRRRVFDTSIPPIEDESKILTIIVQPKIENYDITTDDTICYNQVPTLITSDPLGPPTGGDGTGIYTYYWEDSVSGGSWNEIAGAEDETFLPPGLTETTYYRRTVQSGIGCPKTSNISTVTVLPLITNNDIITADQIICEGFEFALLDAEGYPVLNGGNTAAGDFRFEWIESTDGSTWNSAYGPNTNEDYAPDTTSSTFPSTDTVQFRRIVLSGPADVCIDTSNVVKLNQWPKITNNVVPYDLEYCENDDPDPVIGSTPGGGNGVDYLFQWEKLEGAWSVIGGETAKDFDPGELTDSLFYRRIVTSDVCKDTSLVDTIPVNPALQHFNIQTLSGGIDTTICFGATPNRLIPEPTPITGGDGTYVYAWEKSEDGGTNWVFAGGTFEYFDPPILNDTTIYRRNVVSNVCTKVSDDEITINVLPAIADNTLSANASVCDNLPATISGSDPTGGAGAGNYTYLWEQSPDDAAWSPADGINDQKDYTSPGLTVPTYYRRTVFSGLSDCCQDISDSQLITIDPLPTATLDPIDVTICEDTSQDLTFNLTGASDWQLTYTDGFSDFIINNISSNAPNETVTPPATGEFTDYIYSIVDLVDGNGCYAHPDSLTGNAKIHVDGKPSPNAGDDADVCGLTYTLQASTDFGSGSWTFPIAVVDAADNTNPNKVVTVDTYGTHNFIWTVINGVCAPEAEDVDITFFEPPTAADAGPDTILLPLTTEINLYGNTPLVGTGEWSKVPGDAQAVIIDSSSPQTLVTNLSDRVDNKFVWTISNGVCPVESDEVIVSIILFRIPSGFSPNGDQINDYFVISGIMDYPNELIILNRQGTEVFRTINYQNDWDGKYSSGDDVPDDTYYYILYYTKEGTRYVENGWLIIKR